MLFLDRNYHSCERKTLKSTCLCLKHRILFLCEENLCFFRERKKSQCNNGHALMYDILVIKLFMMTVELIALKSSFNVKLNFN